MKKKICWSGFAIFFAVIFFGLLNCSVLFSHYQEHEGLSTEIVALSVEEEKSLTIDDYKIIDGDTIYCTVGLGLDIYKREKIRLDGVDTPELRSSDPEERRAAKKAKEFVERSLGSSYQVFIVSDGSRGKYGRLLAKVRYYQDGEEKDLTEELISNNMGKVY